MNVDKLMGDRFTGLIADEGHDTVHFMDVKRKRNMKRKKKDSLSVLEERSGRRNQWRRQLTLMRLIGFPHYLMAILRGRVN